MSFTPEHGSPQPPEQMLLLEPEHQQLELHYPDYGVEPLAAPHDWAAGALQKYHDTLQKAIHTDRLTGLANMNGLEKIITHLPRNIDHVVLFVDTDAFKAVNAAIGHDAADVLLAQIVAPFLQSRQFRDLKGQFARRSGDEFVGIFPAEPIDQDRRSSESRHGRGRRKDEDGIVALENRLNSEWDEYIETYDGEHLDLLERAKAVGFGITMGTIKLDKNASVEDTLAAIDRADKLMEEAKTLNSVKLLDTHTAQMILNVNLQMAEIGVTYREMPRLVEAARMYLALGQN